MYLSAQPEVEAGGVWAISVYDLRGAEVNAITSSAAIRAPPGATPAPTTVVPSDVGGDTPVNDRSPVASGKRAFTVVNNCSQKIRVGSTGGR